MWLVHALTTLSSMKESININDYSNQLMQLCNVCQRSYKCKDKSKICFAKWTAFKAAKMKYRKERK